MKVKDLIKLLEEKNQESEVLVWGLTTDDGQGTIMVEGDDKSIEIRNPHTPVEYVSPNGRE